MPGRPHHSEKWHRCWEKVQNQGHSASSAAAICTESIGDESFAEGTPADIIATITQDEIRDAGGSVPSYTQTRDIHLVAAAGKIRTSQYRGREHIVIPITALVEGVLHAVNSSEPELVLAEEFALAHTSWNGRPVMMNHPEAEGKKISANDPTVLELNQLGQVFHTQIVDRTLAMEAWVDPERAAAIGTDGKRLLERIKTANPRDPLEVSVGVFMIAEAKDSEFNGKPYKAIWRHITPDHLAILSEGRTGACSVAMGCGTRYLATAKAGYEEIIAGGELRAACDCQTKPVALTTAEADAHIADALVADALILQTLGGQGSGNWGHSGRPGEIGGSGDSGGKDTMTRLRDKKIERLQKAGKPIEGKDYPTGMAPPTENRIPKGGHQEGDRVRVRGNNGRAAVGGEGKRGTISSSQGSFHVVKFSKGESASYHESDLHNLSRR